MSMKVRNNRTKEQPLVPWCFQIKIVEYAKKKKNVKMVLMLPQEKLLFQYLHERTFKYRKLMLEKLWYKNLKQKR